MFDTTTIIQTAGLLGIWAIVFLESGVFFGFFLPGDTLLFSAGIFASQGYFSLPLLIIGCAIACIVGDSVGYWTGKRMGPALFEKDASFFFKKKRVYDAEHFYKKHGPITIIAARFIPVIRTFAPIVAGVANMHYKTFIRYNIIGGILWSVVVPTFGYYLGSLIPNPDRFLLPIIIFVLCVSFAPFVLKFGHYLLTRKK